MGAAAQGAGDARRLAAAKILLAVKTAQQDLRAFIQFMMPDSDDPDDPGKTVYHKTPQGTFLCQVIEDTAAGSRKRTGVSMPPQHGKTMHLSTYGIAWLMGRFPQGRFIVATYNEVRAGELGEDLKQVLQNPRYARVFPEVRLLSSSKSKTAMRTEQGARVFFTGRGGTITGRTADFFIIDDPLKDDEEATSDTVREKLWTWFFSVAYSRGSNKTAIIVLHTRWHEDDLLGRLCDPDHPERRKRFKGIADDWTYINLPAVVTDPQTAKLLGLALKTPTTPAIVEQFGDRPMAALYAQEKNLDFLAQWRRGDARTFDALAMGKPSPDEGSYFLATDIVEYQRHELPTRLRKFAASDHAVSKDQRRDPSVLGCVGVDESGTVWVLPDLCIARMETDRLVQEILTQITAHQPELWFMESELISKSFGPFLKAQMREQNIFTTIVPMTPSKDKEVRARAIQGRIGLQTVRFPGFAPWWAPMRAQLLRFPHAANDDFVDWLAHIGQGLLRIYGPGRSRDPVASTEIREGSIEWILRSSRSRALKDQRRTAQEGW